MTALQLSSFTFWLGMEILGVSLLFSGYATAGWAILGVFTSLALLLSISALGVHLRKNTATASASSAATAAATAAATTVDVPASEQNATL